MRPDLTRISGQGILEPSSDFVARHSTFIARYLVSLDGAPVRLLNAADQPRVIKSGTMVGWVENTEVVATTTRDSTDTQELPSHMEALLSDMDGNLTEDRRRMSMEHLVKFRKLFDKNDDDLGRTDRARHSIKTGDAKPIRHKPRRVPIHAFVLIIET